MIYPKPISYAKTGSFFRAKKSLSVKVPEEQKAVLMTVKSLFKEFDFIIEPEKIDILMTNDHDIISEAYRLNIDEDHIELFFSDSAGAFYGLISLCQALTSGQLACGTIQDWPGLNIRGFMLDISRGKVPTLESLKTLVDKLAIFKINHFQLYLEGLAFAYPEHSDLWKDKTPITPEEILDLDLYCRDRFIDLVACQNGLGHMAGWFSSDAIRSLAECEDGFEVFGRKFPPTTLDASDERSYEFVKSLFEQLLPNFSSKLCNACLDEPFEMCMCKNKGKNKFELYAQYANRLNNYIKSRDLSMMMWGDIAAKDPRVLELLADDILILDWGYEAEYPFFERAALLSKSNREFCLCPGTNSWLTFTGNSDNMLNCVKNAAKAAYEYGAKGLILTDWGDAGHLQYIPISYAGLAYAAAYAWSPYGATEQDAAKSLDLFIFKDKAGLMGKLAFDAGRYEQFEEFRLANRSLASTVLSSDITKKEEYEKHLALFAMSVGYFSPDVVAQAYTESYEQRGSFEIEPLLRYLESLEVKLSKSRMECEDSALVKNEFENALKMVKAGSMLRDIILNDGKHPKLNALFYELISDHRRLWLARNKEHGLEEGLEPIKELKDRFQKCMKQK